MSLYGQKWCFLFAKLAKIRWFSDNNVTYANFRPTVEELVRAYELLNFLQKSFVCTRHRLYFSILIDLGRRDF